ncbi:monoacylglycerol lipase ABHD6-like isoform X2 [Sycon ciliatum]|uniref:monoacylglycerol lipase ABHD6-like isoform X2 n=1 Tax=Sycon ciliatum TaxID=27933 RepID=UPI0020ADDEC1|eukprot:scpid35953/ scgid2376/ Monoacylglycerol lipase ABHD6; 2-arachidonoylglycerol hydrolase; Abhydrolase domain-containing protein 6
MEMEWLAWVLLAAVLLFTTIFLRLGGLVPLFDAALAIYLRWRQFRCRATKKCIELSDYKFMYLEHGSASRERPTVLLLHGFTSGKEEWSEIMRLLGSACHVIAVDMPGHGETTRNPRGDHSIVGAVARVRQFVEAVGILEHGFHVVGSSWGGHVAGVYASKYPDRLHSLTLMCPSGLEPKNITRFVRALMEGRNYLLPVDSEEFAEFLSCVFYRQPPLPRWALAIGLRDRVPHYPFFETVFDQLMEPDQRFLLQKSLVDIKAATLAMWGKYDQVLDPSGLEILSKEISNCEGHSLDECGHTVAIEQAAAAGNLIKQHILRHHQNSVVNIH